MAKYEEMCRHLRREGFEEGVIDIFRQNKIDTVVFLKLNRADFQELGVTAIGDRRRLQIVKEKVSIEVNKLHS